MNRLRPLFVLLLGSPAVAMHGMDLQTLVERSPFAPVKQDAGSGVAEQAVSLEFRGRAVDAAGVSFSIYDTTTNRGYWLREGVDGSLRIKSYNPANDRLEVEIDGKVVALQLKQATIQAGAPIAVASPRGDRTAVGRRLTLVQPGQFSQTGQANPPDAARLEAVAREVAKRRALRNAAGIANAPAQPGVASRTAP